MAFAPSDYIGPQSSPARRTVIFWLFMLVLAALLWKMAQWQVGNELNYSDFMQQVEKNNVASAKLLMGQNTSWVQGTLREHAARYSATVPKEVVADLTERLRKQGIPVTISERRDSSSVRTILNFAPLVLLIVLWIVMSRRTVARQKKL